ncbi:unnamed protein product, partial [Mesorhabditis belari]|uniref:Uncharacterized protein n=1 Tax=Mesorhabditis belari TaxID=2138241 RepID=A0AAF3F0H0_9BILA
MNGNPSTSKRSQPQRPRHASLPPSEEDEDPPSPNSFTHRRTDTRFPTHVNEEVFGHNRFPTGTNEELFMSVDRWDNNKDLTHSTGFPNQPRVNWRTSNEEQQHSENRSSKNNCLRLLNDIRSKWTWKHYLAAGFVVFLVMALLITAIVLLVVLKKGSGATNKNIFSTKAPPTTPVVPRGGSGYVRALEMNVFKVNESIESLTPVYEEPGLFFGLLKDQIYLFNVSEDSPKVVGADIDRQNASNCRLLFADLNCFEQSYCNRSQLIYCCFFDFPKQSEFCSFAGNLHSDYEMISSYRYNETKELHLATISGLNEATIDYEKDTYPGNQRGPKQCASFGDKRILAAGAAFKPSSPMVNLLAAVSDTGELYINYRDDTEGQINDFSKTNTFEACFSDSASVFASFPENSTILDISVDFFDPNFYIAVTSYSALGGQVHIVAERSLRADRFRVIGLT